MRQPNILESRIVMRLYIRLISHLVNTTMSTSIAGAETGGKANLDELDSCMRDLETELKSEEIETSTARTEIFQSSLGSLDRWWHADMQSLASQLSSGVLKEMKKRILTSNIQKEKLALNESTQRMRDFFGREISRYTKRLNSLNAKKQVVASLEGSIKRSEEEIASLKNTVDNQMTLLRKIAQKYGKKNIKAKASAIVNPETENT